MPKSSSHKRKFGDRATGHTAVNTENNTNLRPALYSPHLRPLPSALRSHVLARERLRLWRPIATRNTLNAKGKPTNIPQSALAHIEEVITGSWEVSTREMYGSGLLIYHVFCDDKQIPEDQRAPMSPILAASFISTIAGAYSGQTIRNYFYGHQENGWLVFRVFIFQKVSSAIFVSTIVSQLCLCLSHIIFGLSDVISGIFQVSLSM